MDLVYPLRRKREHEELRYSLRSMEANLPHDQVWIVGRELPKWAQNLHLVTVPDRGTKWQNIPSAIAAACQVSERFVLANDDFFVMAPIGEMPVYHRGTVDEASRQTGTYNRGLVETAKLLRDLGVEGELLNYELHAPMPVIGEDMVAALRRARGFRGRCLQARTLYGNLHRVGGEHLADMKVHGSHQAEGPFLSTTDSSFVGYPVGERIREAFPEPSRYEGSSR